MNLAARCIWKPARIFSRIWDSRFSQHLNFTSSLSIPLSFDSPEAHQRRSLLENLISWVDAREATVFHLGEGGGTLFRTIAVAQWARNLGNTNMISSGCPASWQNAEIVWLLLQWKISQVKHTTQASFTTTPTYLDSVRVDTLRKHHHTWGWNLNIRETDIYNQSYVHLTVCFFTTSSSSTFFFNGELRADGKDSADAIFTHKYINEMHTTTFVTEWKVVLLARRR